MRRQFWLHCRYFDCTELLHFCKQRSVPLVQQSALRFLNNGQCTSPLASHQLMFINVFRHAAMMHEIHLQMRGLSIPWCCSAGIILGSLNGLQSPEVRRKLEDLCCSAATCAMSTQSHISN